MGRGNAHVQPRCSESYQCPLLVDTEQDRGVGWHTGARLPAVSAGAFGPLEPGPHYTLFSP